MQWLPVSPQALMLTLMERARALGAQVSSGRTAGSPEKLEAAEMPGRNLELRQWWKCAVTLTNLVFQWAFNAVT